MPDHSTSSSTTGNNSNIFLTTENLAFSLPLIIVCVTYVYFAYIPLHIGVPILVAVFVLEQIRRQFKKLHDKKLTNLDEGAIQDIIGELVDDENDKENNTAIQKAKHRVQLRLAMERKAAARKGGSNNNDDNNNELDDATDNLTTFAKGSTGTTAKSKKK